MFRIRFQHNHQVCHLVHYMHIFPSSLGIHQFSLTNSVALVSVTGTRRLSEISLLLNRDHLQAVFHSFHSLPSQHTLPCQHKCSYPPVPASLFSSFIENFSLSLSLPVVCIQSRLRAVTSMKHHLIHILYLLCALVFLSYRSPI